MEIAAIMMCLVMLVAVLVGIAVWFGDRQMTVMRTMCDVIGDLHTMCPHCGGRGGPDHVVVAGQTIPDQTRQEPTGLLEIAPRRTTMGG